MRIRSRPRKSIAWYYIICNNKGVRYEKITVKVLVRRQFVVGARLDFHLFPEHALASDVQANRIIFATKNTKNSKKKLKSSTVRKKYGKIGKIMTRRRALGGQEIKKSRNRAKLTKLTKLRFLAQK